MFYGREARRVFTVPIDRLARGIPKSSPRVTRSGSVRLCPSIRTVARHREHHKDTGDQRHCGTDAQKHRPLRCLPFKDRACVLRPKEDRRESLHTHDGSERAQHPWRTRGCGRQEDDEPHGNADSASRIESCRRCEVQPSNFGPALGRNQAAYAYDNREERHEQRGHPHACFYPSNATISSTLQV